MATSCGNGVPPCPNNGPEHDHRDSRRSLETSRNVAVEWCVNERLRTAMMRTGVTTEDLAECCGVGPKTIER